MIFTLENLRYLTLWLNRLSMLLGFIIGMGYTYLAMPGPMGIVGGLLTASAHLMLMWITSNNALGYTAHTAYPGVVITLGILATLLSSFSVFIHTYYSMMLLAPLLPLPTVFILGLSILIAVCCTVSNLLFSAVQLSRPYRETPAWMEQKILSFSNFTSVLHTLITLGHIWALEGSISSFCMGLISFQFLFNRSVVRCQCFGVLSPRYLSLRARKIVTNMTGPRTTAFKQQLVQKEIELVT